MKKIIFGFLILLAFLSIVYLIGPRPDYPSFDGTPSQNTYSISEVESLIVKDNQDPRIMSGCQAEIVWADSIKRKTPYVIVYFHGFSAAHPEGHPVHRNIASEFGCNLFLTRFPDHGILDSNSYKTIVPKDWIDYGKQAIAMAKALGDKVVIMSTSTGGTVSVYLTANDPSIAGQILLSPNLDLYDPNSHLLNNPWGYQIGKMVLGGDYRRIEGPDSVRKYWTMDYHLQGLVALRDLLDETMTDEVFSSIKSPVFLGYYYKDEEYKDEIVSIPAMQHFIDVLTVDDDKVEFIAFPESGNHVIGSVYWNPNYSNVEKEISKFLSDVIQVPRPETVL